MDSSSRPIEVKWLAVSALWPNPWNPNAMDRDKYAKLAAAIAAGGCVDPLLVRPWGDGHQIVDGEHRWRIARELGLATVPCVVLELGELEARLKTLQLNGLRGANDPERLAALLCELHGELEFSALAAQLPWDEAELEQLVALGELEVERFVAEVRTPAALASPELELFALAMSAEQRAEIEAAIRVALGRGQSRDPAEALPRICREWRLARAADDGDGG